MAIQRIVSALRDPTVPCVIQRTVSALDNLGAIRTYCMDVRYGTHNLHITLLRYLDNMGAIRTYCMDVRYGTHNYARIAISIKEHFYARCEL